LSLPVAVKAEIPMSQPVVEEAPAVDMDHIDRSLVGGIAWTGMAKWSIQLLSWATTLILARLLTPDDFGLVALAQVYIGLVALINEMGLGSAVVTFRDLSREHLAQINTVALLLGLCGFAVSCVMAVPLGIFFASPHLVPVLLAMSTSFVISSFKTVPMGLLQREFDFKTLALVEAGQAGILALSQATLAFMGLGYWSLVLGELLALALATAYVASRRFPGFARPRIAEMSRITTFTFHLLVTRVAWYMYSDADFIIVGKVLGQAALGVYKVAWILSTSPVQKVSELVTRVTPSVFSAVQKDMSALRRYVLRITEALSLAVFPLASGLCLVADDFVKVALGDQWLGAITPLRILGFYVSFRTINTILPQVLTVIGETKFGMRNGIFAVIVMPTAFLIGSHWGMAGVACGWLVAYPLVAIPMYIVLFRRIELRGREYLDAIRPALGAALVMSVAVIAVRWGLSPAWSTVARLLLQAGIGAAVYVGFIMLFHRERVTSLLSAVRKARG
jgi:PST family polysaccharide transporter